MFLQAIYNLTYDLLKQKEMVFVADNNEMFELLTKMYSEFQSMKSDVNERFDTLETRFDNMEGKVDNLENEVGKINMTIENEIKSKIEALFDGYK